MSSVQGAWGRALAVTVCLLGSALAQDLVVEPARGLRLYQGPNTGTEVLATLRGGAEVEAVGLERHGWLRVVSADEEGFQEGYVLARYLKSLAAPGSQDAEDGEGLELSAGPGGTTAELEDPFAGARGRLEGERRLPAEQLPPESAFQALARRSEPSWVRIARKELGVREAPGRKNNKRIQEYHRATTLGRAADSVPWCSSFVNWVMKKAGKRRTRSAAARSWLSYGKKLKTPKKGCIVIFSRGNNGWSGHVGFYMGRRGNRILVLGGNQSNRVSIKGYRKSRLLGYRWPR